MAIVTTKGLSAAAFKKLRQMFPYERPKENASLVAIQRKEGREDVMDFIQRHMTDDS